MQSIHEIVRLTRPAKSGSRGWSAIAAVRPDGSIREYVSEANSIMDGMPLAAAYLFSGNIRYKAAAMYFEFENLSDPADSPVVPTFTQDEDVDYFLGLQYNASKDFIRVPLVAQPTITETDDGFVLSLYAITSDSSTGYNGKAFAASSNSAVFGGAVVASPEAGVVANDVVIARNYPSGAKVDKVDGEQIVMTWSIEFVKPSTDASS